MDLTHTYISAHVAGKQQQLNCHLNVYHSMSVSVAVSHLIRKDMWVFEWWFTDYYSSTTACFQN